MKIILRSSLVVVLALLVMAAPLRAMILLTATTSSVEIVLGGAVSTTQLPWTSSYADITSTTFTPGSSNGASNSTTPVTVVAAPGASTQRQVKFLSVFNADTATATVTVRYNANGTIRIITTIALPVGYTLEYTDGHGFAVLDTTGAIQSSSSGSSAPIDAQYWTGAANATLTAEKNLGALATALVVNTGGVPSAYAGTTCTNQFARVLSALGAATCASVSLTADITGTLAAGNGGTGNTAATDDTVLLGNGVTFDLKAIADCVDTGGNHLNYTASTNTISCGTSGGGSSKLTTYTVTKANIQDTASETTILSFTVTANTWADGDFLYVDWTQLIKTNDGGTGTTTYKVNAGAGAQVTLGTPSHDDDATEYQVSRQFAMRRVGSTVWISQALPVSLAGNGQSSGSIVGTSTPTNFTSDFTVSVKVTFEDGTATKYIKPQGARAWKIAE